MSKRRSKVKHLNVRDDTDDKSKKQDILSATSKDTIMQIDTNVESNNGHDTGTFGHSTPVRAKGRPNDIEDSPEIDYRCSPILIQLTQDSNEVAWDWHSSTNKSDKKDMCKNINSDTPKRTKLLQKKRNSNSPLLYKPNKRKLAKLENTESIGEFAAELQAITKQMKNMKRNNDKFDNVQMECKNETNESLCTGSNVQNAIETKANPETKVSPKEETKANTCSISQLNTSFDDLFDDSINDSMIRCSQEIEAKFNTGNIKKNNVPSLSTVSEETEFSIKTEHDIRCITAGNSSSDNSKTSYASENSLTFNKVNNLKTYSRTSSSSELNSSPQNMKIKKDVARLSYLNNNIHNETSSLLKSSSAELFEIPDDSFDDCLATCMESDPLPKYAEHDNVFSQFDQNAIYDTQSCKTTYTSQGNTNVSSSVSKPSASYEQPRPNNYQINPKMGSNACTYPKVHNTGTALSGMTTTKAEGSSGIGRENRKFFKTKSLSDSYFDHGQTTNVNNKVNVKVNLDRMFESSSSTSSQPKKWDKSNTSMNNPLASAQFGRGVNTSEDKKLSSLNGTHNAYALNFNRSTGQGGGSQITRHHSLSSLNTDTKDLSRGTQGTLCTPEEIERKRLEAKMRLEAKKKQQLCAKSASVMGNFTRGPVKR